MDPIKPPTDIALIAMWLLGLLVVAGIVVILVIVLRCTFAYVAACEKDYGLREIFAEILVVLMALITRPGKQP